MATQMGRAQLPIDRGWAWVITFASCGIFGFIASGHKIKGIILVELQERFPEASVTSLLWVLSLNVVIDRVLGPLNGMILARTSNRTLSVIGSCIMTASLVAFAYSPRIEYMFVAYAFYGWGSGLNSLSCMTAYQPYFDKRKALSLGITGSGSGAGTLILAAVLRLLFDNFSFSGAMLLYAGVCMQTVVLACLFRPFSFYDRNNQSTESSTPEDTVNEENNSLIMQGQQRMRSMSVGQKRDDSNTLKTPAMEFLSIPTDLHTVSANNRKLTNEQIFALSAQDISASALILERKAFDNETKRFNWRLAYNPRCILLGVSILLHVSAMTSAYPCLPPLGVQTGVSKKLISILMAAAGLLEIPLRILNGWLADRKVMTGYNQLTLCLFITGITALLCATISGTAGIVLMLIGLSSTGTSVFTLLPVVCGELFGGKNVQTGMSIIFVYHGLAIVIGTFSSGAIYERTQGWENVFYYISASMVAAGTVMLATAVVTYFINKKKHDEETAS